MPTRTSPANPPSAMIPPPPATYPPPRPLSPGPASVREGGARSGGRAGGRGADALVPAGPRLRPDREVEAEVADHLPHHVDCQRALPLQDEAAPAGAGRADG